MSWHCGHNCTIKQDFDLGRLPRKKFENAKLKKEKNSNEIEMSYVCAKESKVLHSVSRFAV